MARWAFERIDPRPLEGLARAGARPAERLRAHRELSLRATRIEPAGDGALLARIEEARRRLDADGLFDASRKRRPPLWPRRIGLIGGRDAAAPLDVIRNAWRAPPLRALRARRDRGAGRRAVPRSCARSRASTPRPTST